MSNAMTADIRGEPRVHVDEVGLAFAVVGCFRVQTAFQPVFARFGAAALAPVALTASSVIRRDGGGLAHAGDLSEAERAVVARLAPELAIRNLQSFDAEIDDLQLVVDLPAWVEDTNDLAPLLAVAESAGVSTRCLAFDVTARLGAGSLTALAAAAAGRGASLCVDLLGVPDLPEAVAQGGSRLVRIPSAAFGRILSEVSPRRLMASLVSTLHRTGFIVQVEGLSTIEATLLALDVGVDRLQGDLLAPSALAGAAFDSGPRPIADPAVNRGTVVSISA